MALFEKQLRSASPMGLSSPSSRSSKKQYLAGLGLVLVVVFFVFQGHRHNLTPSRVLKPAGLRPATDAENAVASPERMKSNSITLDPHLSTPYNETSAASDEYTTTIVLGRMSQDSERIQWVYDDLQNITERAVYMVDNSTYDGPHLDRNHGREAMVYMKYIVDNYDSLSDITFFWHSDKKVWHNNLLLGEDSVATINRMNRAYIMQQGYVGSRCDHWPGCPDSWAKFDPSKAEHRLDPHRLSDMFSTYELGRIWPEETEFPRYFAGTCCSQFAVSRDTIRSNSVETYRRIISWLEDWPWDQYTGRALEVLWPYIFLKRGRNCPSMQDCYCRTYGVCLETREEIALLERWNEVRTRADELEWQQYFRSEEIKSEGWADVDERIATDEEHNRLSEDMKSMRERTQSLRARMNQRYSLPESEVTW